MDSLYSVDVMPVQTTIVVDRNPTTGQLLGYKEVRTNHLHVTLKHLKQLDAVNHLQEDGSGTKAISMNLC